MSEPKIVIEWYGLWALEHGHDLGSPTADEGEWRERSSPDANKDTIQADENGDHEVADVIREERFQS